ncbi:MAG: hypothetical protein ABJ333_16505 [Algoriphagus sp.]
MSKTTQRGMIIHHARFSRSAAADGTGYPASLVTGQVMILKIKF